MNYLKQIWQYKDLRYKVFWTIGLLFVFRFLAHIPIPGVSEEAIKQFFQKNAMLGLLDLFSGGALRQFSVVMMGVGPYITASIIMQLLMMIIPSLEELAKEGELGQKKINQYTRYLTVPLALFEAYGLLMLLKNQNLLPVTIFTPFNLLLMLVSATAGTIFLMWLGELISEKGIGNGISIIIAVGIISNFPREVGATFATITEGSQWIWTIIMIILTILVIFGIVFVNEAQRNIPVSYAKRIRGMRMYGGVSTYLPLRVTTAGVIPIIFAISIMSFPLFIVRLFEHARSSWLVSVAKFLSNILVSTSPIYIIFYFILVVLFTYFYTAVIFNPLKIAENIQKQGGFIPGIRPGRQTAEYLNLVMNRITLAGAIFLGIIAILPFLIQIKFPQWQIAIGGTGILIIVSVILETMKQLQSLLLTKQYERY